MKLWIKKLIPKCWKLSFREYILSIVCKEQIQYETLQANRINELQAQLNELKGLINEFNSNSNASKLNPDIIAQLNNLKLNEIDRSVFLMENHLQKLDAAAIMNFRSLPELLAHNEESLAVVKTFTARHQVDFDFNISIARDDIMFMTSLGVLKSFNETCKTYFTDGYRSFNVLRKLVNSKYGAVGFNGKILDFASGYGRVSRFLAGYYGSDHIVVSEVKEDAVNFQTRQFGVKGMYSVFEPDELKCENKFDVVFVGSLFTHLPEILFVKWILKLAAMLTPTGMLIFTVHDKSLYPGSADFDFCFKTDSEDQFFSFVENKIIERECYGVTFVSEKFVSGVLEKAGKNMQYKRYIKAFPGKQDVYAVTFDGQLPTTEALS